MRPALLHLYHVTRFNGDTFANANTRIHLLRRWADLTPVRRRAGAAQRGDGHKEEGKISAGVEASPLFCQRPHANPHRRRVCWEKTPNSGAPFHARTGMSCCERNFHHLHHQRNHLKRSPSQAGMAGGSHQGLVKDPEWVQTCRRKRQDDGFQTGA